MFRAVADVYPTEIDDRYKGNGVFGPGTYYGQSYRLAWEYAVGGYARAPTGHSVITEYQASFSNLLTITEADLEGISDIHGKMLTMTDQGLDTFEYEQPVSFLKDELTKIISDDGYDGVRLLKHAKGSPDGGPQIIIPSDSTVEPEPKKLWIVFKDKKEAKEFAEEMDLVVDMETGHVKVPLDELSEADTTLAEIVYGQ